MFGIRSETRSTAQRRVLAVAAAMATFGAVQTAAAGMASAAPSSCDTVGNLVADCGFEAGVAGTPAPPSWILTSAPAYATNEGVDSAANGVGAGAPSSGALFFAFGASGADDTLSQVVAGTTPGATYALSFNMADISSMPQALQPDFFASVQNAATGTVTAVSMPAMNSATDGGGNYLGYAATFVAGTTSPTLVFAGQHPNGWIDLDDVVVRQVPAVTTNPPVTTNTTPPVTTNTTPPVTTTTTPPVTTTTTPPVTTTPSKPVVNPGIVANVSSYGVGRYGWYNAPVTVTFSCTPGSAPFASPCPDPVTFSQDKLEGSVTARVADTDGGVASVTTAPIGIDLDAPSLSVSYHAGQCIASDQLSGVASCVIHRVHIRGLLSTTTRWTATAIDNAGNVAQQTGSYRGY